ncbi:hypothetical protein D3C80_1679580 [compost metagenome]
MKFLDGQGFNKARPILRRNDGLAIRFVQVACHLGQKLVVGDAGRCIEAGDRLDFCADLQRNFGGDLHAFQVFGDIEIGFVER